MKALGIVLIVLGLMLAYLGYYGKVGDAWNAILTGNASTNKPIIPVEDKSVYEYEGGL